jgi:hypothetical protein
MQQQLMHLRSQWPCLNDVIHLHWPRVKTRLFYFSVTTLLWSSISNPSDVIITISSSRKLWVFFMMFNWIQNSYQLSAWLNSCSQLLGAWSWGTEVVTDSDRRNRCIESASKLHDNPIETAVSSLSPVRTCPQQILEVRFLLTEHAKSPPLVAFKLVFKCDCSLHIWVLNYHHKSISPPLLISYAGISMALKSSTSTIFPGLAFSLFVGFWAVNQ